MTANLSISMLDSYNADTVHHTVLQVFKALNL